jgi:NAD(P)-dependent dehydrogenase (short-subunit alcohol dehydrogenase family)
VGRLTGRIALVTGASRSIGGAIAIALAKAGAVSNGADLQAAYHLRRPDDTLLLSRCPEFRMSG